MGTQTRAQERRPPPTRTPRRRSTVCGIAHDFNNLLTTMIGSLELALELDPADATNVRELVGNALDSARRASALSRRLMSLARRGSGRPSRSSSKAVDIADLVRELLPLLTSVLGREREFDVSLPDAASPAPTVLADPTQIEQLVLNLVSNARDATAPRGRVGLLAGGDAEQVVLEVSDDGVGIDADARARVFEPFFTTKGEGTGLGLASCMAIVEGLDGSIALDSTPRAGSRFTITLPRTTAPARALVKTADGPTLGGDERVLIVEDQPAVLELAARILGDGGYRVHTASSVGEAQALLRPEGPRIDLLVADLDLPDGDGEELIAAQPESQAVVLISGSAPPDDLVGAAHRHHLPRPFPPRALLEAARAALDAALDLKNAQIA